MTYLVLDRQSRDIGLDEQYLSIWSLVISPGMSRNASLQGDPPVGVGAVSYTHLTLPTNREV